MKLSPRLTHQLLIGAGLVTAFVVMASIFVPARSQAEGDGADLGAAQSLGRLESGRYVIEIFATPQGARYTISGGNGSVLARGLSADQVAERFEGLELPHIRADVPLTADDHSSAP